MDSGYSDSPSPSSSTSSRMMGSPMSQGSDNTQYNMQMLRLYPSTNESMGKADFQTSDMIFPLHTSEREVPQIVIVEQPVDKFRFRYKSEMHGTHGSLMGASNGKSKKTFPTVELRGYNGKALIRCSLYQTNTLKPSPHSHKLVVRHGDVDMCDPHDVCVSPGEGFRASFQGMGIIHTAKKYIVEELINKKIKEATFQLGRHLTTLEESKIKILAEQEAKTMNLNQVRLGFTAYAVNSDETLTQLCEPIFSRPINNMKSALTGELKIARLSAAVSSAAGGDDLFLFVEKVGKKNIKVRFFEIDEYDDEVWEDWGIFSEADVHHQYAIALRTPPYKNKDIDKHVDVFIQLFRPTDQDKSEPVPFKYKPRDFVTSRKRARTSSSALSSSELPETIIRGIKDSPQSSGSLSSINKSDIINELLKDTLPANFGEQIEMDSEELHQYVDNNFFDNFGDLETDGVGVSSVIKRAPNFSEKTADRNPEKMYVEYFRKIASILRSHGSTNLRKAKNEILDIFMKANASEEDILHNAIRQSDVNVMVKLLTLIDRLEIYDVLQYQNERRESCLHIACIYDKSEYIRPIINLGVNPNIQDYKGNTALHIAVENDLSMCASRIIEKSHYTKKSQPLQIDLANDDGLTPLHLAVKKGNMTLVKKLLQDGGASTKICISKNGNNVLHLAVEQNDKEIIQYLLENTQVNINEQNTSGFTPLRLAYSMGTESKDVAELLLEYGAISMGPSFKGSPEMDIDRGKSQNTDDSSTDEEDEKPLQIDEYRYSDGAQVKGDRFDDICIEQLVSIFDKGEQWEALAKLLNLENYIHLWSNSKTPIRAMLAYINEEDDGNLRVEDVQSALITLGRNDAVKLITDMISRNRI